MPSATSHIRASKPDLHRPAAASARKNSRSRAPLTELEVRSAKPGDKPTKLADGGGLFLFLTPMGSKLWRLKFRVDGKEKLMALGKYPDISLKDAREARDAARKQLALGTDPMAQRKTDKVAYRLSAENTFAAIARLWWAGWKAARSESHTVYVMRRLEADIFPAIGT
jgi:hypothetical protein